MKKKDVELYRALRDALVPLAVSAAELRQTMPSRTGGYLLPLDAIMAQIGRERMTFELQTAAHDHLRWLTGSSADSIKYVETNREFVLQFNDKLVITENYVYFGDAAAQRRSS
jgi:hypothetical protein